MEGIAHKYLCQLQQRAQQQGIQLRLPEALAAKLGAEGKSRGGARHLRHLVQERVEGPLALYLLGRSKTPPKLQGILQDGQLQFVE